MKAAAAPRDKREHRLVVVDAMRGEPAFWGFDAISEVLEPGDVLVVNDAATLPASIDFRVTSASVPEGGARGELRILLDGDGGRARGVLLGDGDHSVRTEDRGAPPLLVAGHQIALGESGAVTATILEVDPDNPRLVRLQIRSRTGGWSDAARALYREGRVIQYAYVPEALALWDVQTVYAGRPWASEMPSAGRPLSWRILGALRARGVEIVRVTHGAGLSSTGDVSLDGRLPLPERYEIDARAAEVITRAKREGRRVIAAGTSVVRALESSVRRTADHGGVEVVADRATTSLVIGRDTELSIVDGLLTGLHESGSSHYALMEAFADAAVLERANSEGEARGLLLHEFGDSMLLFGRSRAGKQRFASAA